jgi:hypothetical protein
LAALFLLLSAMNVFVRQDYLFAGVAAVLAIALYILHRIRVRRFKLYDQAQTFDCVTALATLAFRVRFPY